MYTWLRCGRGRRQRTWISRIRGRYERHFVDLRFGLGGRVGTFLGGGFWFADRRAKEVLEEWIIERDE